MKPDIVYVWSSGLEQWEETCLSSRSNIPHNNYLHTKNVGLGKLQIFKDANGRYLGIFHG
jgi:hypothetical protein